MRTATITKFSLLAGAAVALPTVLGCIEHPLKPVELDSEAGLKRQIQLEVNKDVDILFVIDNSGSMGEEQANLAANFGGFIEELEATNVEANYRIGITTTDNSNPWCGGTTTPEAGALVLSSCNGRLGQFVFTGTNPPTDVTDIACTDICPYTAAELDDMMKPTTTDLDPNPKTRPWLESIEGATNLPDGISTVEAFQCFGPQGIDGCGFESHLESMYKALQRTQSQSQASYGFMRKNAILAIVIVTDEVDCSFRNEFDEIFTDNKVFWEDPDGTPTSAICWNAGVECTGGPGQYDGCRPADLDVNGNLTDDSSQAVLHPLSRYVDLLQGLEQAKKEFNPNQEVIVGVISGVPDGYYKGQGEIIYADSQDAGFQGDFGIGPGCSSPGDGGGLQTAVPPVRLRDWAEEFDDDGNPTKNLYSVCSDDYTPALKAIAGEIQSQIRPACYTECVADVDPAEDGLQVDCYVEETAPDSPTATVPECKLVGEAYEQPSAADNVCYIKLTDATQSGSAADDMSDECIDEGLNLEFSLLRREGFPAAGGTSVTATCKLAEFTQLECPDLAK